VIRAHAALLLATAPLPFLDYDWTLNDAGRR
jgi:hypothetical protein